MKYFRIIISIVALSAILNSCQKDLLEKFPLDQVTTADFFKQPDDLMIYMNRFYNNTLLKEVFSEMYRNGYSGDLNSDNQLTAERIDERLQGTRTISFDGNLSWNFSNVRNINIFFDSYKKVEDKFDLEDYEQYLGEAYFFRALIYFQLLQTFGDVPWITTELNINSPELYGERTPRNIVADNIILALDSAAMYLTDVKEDDGAPRVNKWIALLYQTRVALYEGTWEKYHANDPFGVNNPLPEKYFNKVAEAATLIMNSGIYDIYSTGSPSSDYNDLFSLRDYSSNKEIMFWEKFSSDLGITHHRNYYMEFPKNNSLTKELADSYLCTDGKPITNNPLFGGYTTLNDEMQNRDPRYYQTIFTPDAVWKIDADGTITDWSEVYELLNSSTYYNAPSGYANRKGYDPRAIYQDPSFEDSPAIYYRYAEVLLNFAEAKAELGAITQADIDVSIKKLRVRVGMPNLTLADITVDPKWDFPALSPIINEIRRERRVELCGEGFRWDDIARWAAADELIVGKRPKGLLASQIEASATFTIDENGFLDPFQAALPNGYGFVVDRDYLDPIPEAEIVLNPNLSQNPGW